MIIDLIQVWYSLNCIFRAPSWVNEFVSEALKTISPNRDQICEVFHSV